MEREYVIVTYGLDGRQEHVRTADVRRAVRDLMRAYGVRPTGYAERTYPGRRPVYHEWSLTRGRSIVAHAVD